MALERLASMLPEDYTIFVKSDQYGNSDYLTAMFFHRIKRIQNVVRLPSSFGVEPLIDHSEFVATVNSTDGWKALTRRKKCTCIWKIRGIEICQALTSIMTNSITSEIAEPEFSKSEFLRQVNCLIDQSHTGQLGCDK